MVARLREIGFDVWADPVQWLVRGEGGEIQSHDVSSGTVVTQFDFPEFSMTATVTTQLDVAEFTLEASSTGTPS